MNFQRVYLSECTSTNDFLKSNKFTAPIALYTFHQTQGRGQGGNRWVIAPEKNVAMSFGVPHEKLRLKEVELSMMVANFVRNFIQNKVEEKVSIKWPNDIIVSDQKVSGILIENVHDYWIIGIGINVNQSSFEGLPFASSLFNFTRKEENLKLFSEALMDAFESIFPIEKREIFSLYNHYLYKKNEWQLFKISQKTCHAKILGVDYKGNLLLENEKGQPESYPHSSIQWIL